MNKKTIDTLLEKFMENMKNRPANIEIDFDKFNFKSDIESLLKAVMKNKNQQPVERILDLFTEDFKNDQIIEKKLQTINKILKKISTKYGPATASHEKIYVPTFDEDGDKIGERIAYNLVIKRP